MVEGCYRKIEKRTIAELTKMAIIWNVFELFLPVLRKETLHQPELFVAAKACREGEFFPIRRPGEFAVTVDIFNVDYDPWLSTLQRFNIY
jgi:hypothetical protein